jgi:uncharacterized membrane protein
VRNPLRTEAEAFSFVLVAAVCFLALALAAVFGGRWVGIAVFLALVLGVAVGVYIRSDPRVREPAVWERAAPDGVRRLLVVADEAAEAEAMRTEIVRRLAGADAEVLVVVPGRSTGERYNEIAEEARAVAARVADELASALENDNVVARGTVGDVDVLKALREALRGFKADEVLVSARLRTTGAE